MTPAERARLAALAEAATPGPWDEHEWAVVSLPEVAPVCHAVHEDDAAFIAASRTAVPALLAALADAEAERDTLIGAGCSPEQNALALLDLYHQREQAALSGEADATRRAEAAELGCEIAYRREPTQAEGDAHAYRAHKGDVIEEAHVPMGNHHGHRCRCGMWVWAGPTVCQRCVSADAVACVQAQRDIMLDASADGSWMARALDAERELAVAQATIAEQARYLLSDEERRKLTGDALYAEGELADAENRILAYEEILETRREHARLADERLSEVEHERDRLRERVRLAEAWLDMSAGVASAGHEHAAREAFRASSAGGKP